MRDRAIGRAVALGPGGPRVRRLGCLGCLGKTTLGLILGAVLVMAISGVFTPWAYYFGGSRHLFPVWQGVARMHASSGDYTLYFWIAPTRGTRLHNLPQFNGWGYLCTPRGERFKLRVRASMPERPGTDTNGREMSVTFYRRPWYYNFSWPDRRPEFHFRGRWQNPDLVMSDEGTAGRDGSVIAGEYCPIRASARPADRS